MNRGINVFGWNSGIPSAGLVTRKLWERLPRVRQRHALFQLQTVDAIVDFINKSCINNNKYKKKTNYNIMGNYCK
jgi:hypothetical protein